MGNWYKGVCWDCKTLDEVDENEVPEWMATHWGHSVLIVDGDGDDLYRLTDIAPTKTDLE